MAKAKAAQLELEPRASDTTATNGVETVDDMLGPVPVSRDAVYERLRRELQWRNRTLVAQAAALPHPLQPAQYVIFEVELADNGRVTQVDLGARAIELGLLDPRVERIVDHWQGAPA